jgi:raffinose/stachyose/melibiose transport system permease protein
MFNRYTRWTLVREIVMIIVAILLFSPFYILLTTALKDPVEAITGSPVAPPMNPTFDNFVEVFQAPGQRNILLAMANSAIITAGTLVLLVGLGSIAAYTIGRRTSRMGTIAYGLFVLGIILPFQLGLIPAYVGLRSLGLVGTQFGMILLYTGLLLPMSVFLYSGFVRALPPDYEEAASIDGASRFQVFTRVVFPLLGPATGTVLILTGLVVWNDFFTALVFLSGSGAQTIPVVIYSYVGANSTAYNHIFAIVIVSMIPVLVAYFFAQRHFIQGFAGGVKG